MNDKPPKPWVSPYVVDGEGLVGAGGPLTPATLVEAYFDGVFPWYNEGDPVLWWSPDPRGVIDYSSFHVSRRLERTIRSGKFDITFDKAFPAVMRSCGATRPEGSWITAEMLETYEAMHRIGLGHSVEAWYKGYLVGGVYGIGIGGFFSAESMFHLLTDAGKVALVALVRHLRKRGYELLDVQILNDHTQSMGAFEIPRDLYLRRLRRALRSQITFV